MGRNVGFEPNSLLLERFILTSNDHYFMLYDYNDNIICYINNFEELKKFLPRYRKRDLLRRFKNSSLNYIDIIISNSFYKLYMF